MTLIFRKTSIIKGMRYNFILPLIAGSSPITSSIYFLDDKTALTL